MSYRRRKTAADIAARRQQIADLKARLEQYEAELSEAEIAVITARFDGYSMRNALLIAMQMPTATDVDGYKAWQKRGRQVRKGEQGILIFAPAGQTEPVTDDEGNVVEEGRMRYRVAYVFDISQTDEIAERKAA